MIVLCALIASAAPAPMAVAVTASLTLKVTNKDAVADALALKAEAAGGYFSSRTDDSIVLRVPTGAENDVISFAEAQGITLTRELQKSDLSEDIDRAQSHLHSREETLKRYMSVLRDAGAGQVVMVEREIIAQIQDIEQLKGQIQSMQHRARYAIINVAFSFRERAAPLRTGLSSFLWLNTVNLADLLEDFRHAR